MFLAILMYFIPAKGNSDKIVTWKEFEKIPIGVLLLFGGGFALAKSIQVSGLGNLIAQQLDFLALYPSWLIVFMLCLFNLLYRNYF